MLTSSKKKTYRAKFRVIPECRQTLTCRNEINRREKELESIQSSSVPQRECCCDPRIKTPNLQVSDRRLKLEGRREEGRNVPMRTPPYVVDVSAQTFRHLLTWINASLRSRPEAENMRRNRSHRPVGTWKPSESLRSFGFVSKCLMAIGPGHPAHLMFCSPFCRIPKNSGINNVKLSC